jgi:hypothetical protein
MKYASVLHGQLTGPARENFRIYLALVASGASILLMILLEMKLFGS